MNLLKYLLFVLLPMFVVTISDAQLSLMTQLSHTVIEGDVIKKESKWDISKRQIITEHQIKVRHIFKGEISDSIILVITNGGILEDIAQFQPHTLDIPDKSSGYYFLNNDESNISFNLVHNLYGFLQKEKNVNSEIIYFDKIYYSYEIESEILAVTKFPKLSFEEYLNLFHLNNSRSNDTCNILSQLKNSFQIEFKFDSIKYSSDFKYVEFDIMAQVNTPGLKFGKGTLFINYNQAFGTNLVANGTVEITKGNILNHPLYSLSYSDYQSDVMSITADASLGSNDMYTFSDVPSELLHVKVKIEDFTQLGSISFDSIDITGSVFYWCQGSYEIFDLVNLSPPISGVEPQEGSEISIEYTFENAQVTNGNTRFKIDIIATASDVSQYFGGAVEIVYNTSAFGTNVILSGLASFERGPLIANTNVYTHHKVEDLAMFDNIIRIYTAGGINTSGFTVLGQQPIKLGTLTFSILDCTAQKDISFDQIGTINFGGHLHYTGIMPFPHESYKPVYANDTEVGQVCGCADPIISSFSPMRIPAGMGEVLTIEGVNFLNLEGDSKIFFRNGDDGGFTKTEINMADIVSWTNTKIEVKVPGTGKEAGFKNPPCSGKFEVHTRCGEVQSPTELEIPYSILSLRTSNLSSPAKIAMKDGLCIGFSSDIPVWARNTFKTAMVDWCEKIDMNIKVDYINDSSKSIAALDGVSVVTKGVLQPPRIAQLVLCQGDCLSNQDFYIQNCGGSNSVLIEIDFVITEQALNGTMKSLYNVLLHEIGHVLMLNHSKNRGTTLDEEARYVMFADQTNLNFNDGTRLIKADDEEGAQKLFTNSQQAIQNCGFMPISHGNCSLPCGASFVSNSKFIENINIFPNPSDGHFIIKSEKLNILGGKLMIYSFDGKILQEQTIQSESIHVEKSIFPGVGIYIVQILTEEGYYWAEKIIIE